MPALSAAERAAYADVVARLHNDGLVVLDRYSDPSGHWGPEGRAWMKRLDAETLRVRWLSGVDAPPLDVLVDAWRDAVDPLRGVRARPRAREGAGRAGRHPARER